MTNVGPKLLKADEELQKSIVGRHGAFKYLGQLERLYDENGDVLQEIHLVKERGNDVQLTLRINDLRDEQTVQHVLREVEVLDKLGLHKRIMNLLSVFRHKQYVGFVFPAFSSVRDKIDVRVQELKKNTVDGAGVFSRNSVAVILRPVIKALKYLHFKGFVHTQLQASSLYMNENCYVKLGGFGFVRSVHSKNWHFNGDFNLYPPEVVSTGNHEINQSFDFWGLGLLTLELISGRRKKATNERAKEKLEKLLKGTGFPPQLEDYDPSCFDKQECIYDKNVIDFLSRLLRANPKERMDLESARDHPFVAKGVQKAQAYKDWFVATALVRHDESERSLQKEMASVASNFYKLNPDLLVNVLKAVRLAKKSFYPVFEEENEEVLTSKYVLLQLTIAIPPLDEGWSQEVLDRSHDASYDDYKKTVRDVADKSEVTGNSPFKRPSMVNRNDQIFFVRRSWTEAERQTFVALQLARWYHQGLLEMGDVIKMTDEIEALFIAFVQEFGNKEAERASDIYTYSPIREVYCKVKPMSDELKSVFNVYINLSAKPDSVKAAKVNYDQLAQLDKNPPPRGKTTLYQSATFLEVNMKRFRQMEDVVLGSKRASEWESTEFQVDERRNNIAPLVYERRANRNQQWKSGKAQEEFADEHDHELNQARVAKIWGEWDRKYYIQKENNTVELPQQEVINLFGNPFAESSTSEVKQGLDADLLRHKVYQEQDYYKPFATTVSSDNQVQWAEGYYKNTSPTLRKAHPVTSQADAFDLSFDKSKHLKPSPAPKFSIKTRRVPRND